MTQVLSFAEWLVSQQESTDSDLDYEHSMCEHWVCALMDKPKCHDETVDSCPLTRLYEQQKAEDLKKWEKWNAKV